MIQINLLPWREQARKAKQKRFATVAGFVACLAIASIVMAHIRYMALTHQQVKRNAVIQAELDAESNQLMTLNKQKEEVLKIDEQLHFIFDLRQSSYYAVRVVNDVAAANPDGVTLIKIARAGKDITILGTAKSNLQVTLFMEALEKSEFFGQPVLSDINTKGSSAGEERQFELKMIQEDAASKAAEKEAAQKATAEKDAKQG